MPTEDAGKQIFLGFDGAMANAQIWLNGQYVGTWPYGYNSFRMDLTPFLKFGQKNVVAVRLDTEKWESRWYPGAGIYRHVWMVKPIQCMLPIGEPIYQISPLLSVSFNGRRSAQKLWSRTYEKGWEPKI